MRKFVLIAALGLVLALGVVWFQGGFDTLARWAASGQRDVQNAMAGALRRLRAGEAGALLALLGIAFAYGFFHAVGPGHGKVLIGGYGAASRVRLVPLVAIAVAASLAQATTAVLLVGGGVFVLNWTREEMVALGEGAMTTLSILAIALIGLWLAWRGARGLFRQRWAGSGAASPQSISFLRQEASKPARGGALASSGAGVGAAGALAAEEPSWAARSAPPVHAHDHAHEHHGSGDACDSCGHRHGPSIEEVARITSWRDAALLVGAIGIRPCTGALFLLVLTFSMGIGAAGIAGTFAMGLGTATVTIAVAVLAVLARDGALDWTSKLTGLRVMMPVLELTVGGVVVLVAAQMLMRGY